MQGETAFLDYLNFLLAGELAARDQYFIHARMYDEWGYSRLFERIYHEMQDETQHANNIIARILLLGGKPQMQVAALDIGHDVPSMLQADLDVELRVQGELKKGIVLCEENATLSPVICFWRNSKTPRKTMHTGCKNNWA